MVEEDARQRFKDGEVVYVEFFGAFKKKETMVREIIKWPDLKVPVVPGLAGDFDLTGMKIRRFIPTTKEAK